MARSHLSCSDLCELLKWSSYSACFTIVYEWGSAHLTEVRDGHKHNNLCIVSRLHTMNISGVGQNRLFVITLCLLTFRYEFARIVWQNRDSVIKGRRLTVKAYSYTIYNSESKHAG